MCKFFAIIKNEKKSVFLNPIFYYNETTNSGTDHYR